MKTLKRSERITPDDGLDQTIVNAVRRLAVGKPSAERLLFISYLKAGDSLNQNQSKKLLSFLDLIVEELDRRKH